MLHPLVLGRVILKTKNNNNNNVGHGWDNAGKGKPNIRRETFSSATLSTINSHGLACHQSQAPQ